MVQNEKSSVAVLKQGSEGPTECPHRRLFGTPRRFGGYSHVFGCGKDSRLCCLELGFFAGSLGRVFACGSRRCSSIVTCTRLSDGSLGSALLQCTYGTRLSDGSLGITLLLCTFGILCTVGDRFRDLIR